jgi:hypothetical protein
MLDVSRHSELWEIADERIALTNDFIDGVKFIKPVEKGLEIEE